MNARPTTKAEAGVPPKPALCAYLLDRRLRLVINDTVVSLPPGSQPARLLASLLLTPGHALPIDILSEHLWPEEAEDVDAQGHDWAERVRGRLHKLASNLRGQVFPSEATLGLTLSIANGVIALRPSTAIWTDVAAFQQYYQTGQAASHRGDRTTAQQAFSGAVALYSGDVLAHEGDVRWLRWLRDELRMQLLLMLVDLADWALAAGEPHSAIHWAGLGLRHDRTAEELYRALMCGLSRLGRRTLALRQYERCRAVLEELEITPGKATEQLAAALRRGEAI